MSQRITGFLVLLLASGALIGQFIACRNVPIFNLQITQDGKLSPRTQRVFHEAAARADR